MTATDVDPLYVDEETYLPYARPTADDTAQAKSSRHDCECVACGHCRKWHIVVCVKCGCRGFI